MPAKDASNRLHRVTQWMSCVTSTRGSSLSCSQVSVSGVSTSPETVKSQPARSCVYFAAEPAWSTGHFSVRYWPGGSRAGS